MTDLSMPKRQGESARRRVVAAGVIRRTPGNAEAARVFRVQQLHKLCDADYTAAARQRSPRARRDDAHLCAYAAEAVTAR